VLGAVTFGDVGTTSATDTWILVRFSLRHVLEDEVPISPLGPVRHVEIACRLCPSLAKPLTGRFQFVEHLADFLLSDPGTARNQRILDHIVRGACDLRVA